MLRLAVIVLLLANAGYFAWSQGHLRPWGWAPQEQAEPQRMNQQIRPETLQILKVNASKTSSSAPMPAPATPAAPAASTAATDTPASAATDQTSAAARRALVLGIVARNTDQHGLAIAAKLDRAAPGADTVIAQNGRVVDHGIDLPRGQQGIGLFDSRHGHEAPTS